jgi:hypothetical protein
MLRAAKEMGQTHSVTWIHSQIAKGEAIAEQLGVELENAKRTIRELNSKGKR